MLGTSFAEAAVCVRCAGRRWKEGKRGGVRVIYFHVATAGQIRMLFIYRKGVKDDLTQAQKVTLRRLNEGSQ